ncbi:MAG TPA: OmpW family outer membrane protein [Methylibium sp.]|jgi:outer membrane protein|nr:OmpW family outer membrane protein [Methylibium sp.]
MRRLLAAACTTLSLVAPAVHAQDSGDWLVRARAIHLNSENKDRTPLDLSINDRWIPEVDISYFFTPNWATELVLTYPQKQNLRSGALDAKVGTLKHLPPTLSLQYHLTGLPGWRPYAGVGVNYTRFSSVDLPAGVDIQRNSVGPAVGAGFDVPLGDGWLLNVDAKKVWIDTKVSVSGSRIGTFNVDPWLLGIGIGRRF